MKYAPLPLAVSAFVAFCVCMPLAAVEITPSNDASILANALVAPDTGISLVSAAYTGASGAAGLFSSGGNIGIDSGVILTSGSAAGAVGPNTVIDFSVENNTPGDAALSNLAGSDTFDAASLELGFITSTGAISFSFAFTSEEYEEFIDSPFNDVFAFFVNGENIALLPGTSTSAAINSVNQMRNTQFYRSNLNAVLDTQYDDLTTVLTVGISGLSTTAINSLRLSIADAGDASLDSAIFIQGNITGTPIIPDPSPLPMLCISGALLAGSVAWRRSHIDQSHRVS